jgi:hypothetical protein
VSWGPNRLDLFALGDNNAVYHKWWDGSSWGPSTTSWESLGGKWLSRPVAVSWAAHRLDIFALGTASDIWHKWWDGSAWHPTFSGAWEPLAGNIFHGSPAAAARGPNHVDLFGVIGINEVYHKVLNGSSWQPPSNWDALGGTIIGSPTALAPSANSVSLFAVGSPNKDLLTKGWNGQTWQPSMTDWTSLGGVLNSQPAAASWSPLDVHVVALGTDNQMYHLSEFGQAANTWQALGGVFKSAPAMVSWGRERLDIFGLGTDDQMYHKSGNGRTWSPSQTDWEALGGVFDRPRVD